MRILIFMLMISSLSFGYKHSHKKVHHRRGLVRKSRHFFQATKHLSFLKKEVLLPQMVSLKDLSSPVENQGQCGSCWDFSLTGTLRDTLLIAGQKDPGRLSFMYLLNCATDMWGCNGGDMDAAKYMQYPAGPPSWDFQPYTASQGRCKKGAVAASAVSSVLLGTSNGPAFKDIAYVISQLHRPLSTDVAADGNFEEYDDGVYDACSSNQINHMVIISGYDCEGPCVFDANGNLPAGHGKYLIKNSWDTTWGWQGYIWMKATDSRGNRCNAIGSEALMYEIDPGPVVSPSPIPTPSVVPSPTPSVNPCVNPK